MKANGQLTMAVRLGSISRAFCMDLRQTHKAESVAAGTRLSSLQLGERFSTTVADTVGVFCNAVANLHTLHQKSMMWWLVM